jgi:hypothetical protein
MDDGDVAALMSHAGFAPHRQMSGANYASDLSEKSL